MYDKALETSDADFLSPSSDITIDHVRKLNLDSSEKESIPPRVQNRPPQPPKHRQQPKFSLNSFDLLLEEGDAESWLVASPFDEAKRSQLNSAPVCEEKREVVSSPVDSSVSSELSRSTCVTPASVLDTKSVQKLKVGDSSDSLQPVRPRSVEPRLLDSEQKHRDIRNLPRSVGCVNHTPAPPLDKKTRSVDSESSENTEGATSRPNVVATGKQPSSKGLGSKLRGRISGIAQKETRKPMSSIPKARPSSVGPTRCNRLSTLSQPPRPKSSLGRDRGATKADMSPIRSRKLTSTTKGPPRSSCAKSSTSLGTVKEEENEKKRLLGFRKPVTKPGSTAPAKLTLTNSRLANKARKPAVQSRITPQVTVPKPPLNGSVTDNKVAIKMTKPSRIASPSPKSFMLTEKGKGDNKDSKGLMGFKKSSSSLPPPSQSSSSRLRRISQEASKIKQKATAKKRL